MGGALDRRRRGSRSAQTPADAAKSIVDAEGYGAVVIMHSMHEDDVRLVMAHPTTMIGSDGIPTLAGQAAPAVVRNLREGARPLHAGSSTCSRSSQAVHRMTGMPAAKFGLVDRGVIRGRRQRRPRALRPGAINDIATYEAPRQHPAGIRTVWVNGTAVMNEGQHTGERPGCAVRH